MTATTPPLTDQQHAAIRAKLDELSIKAAAPNRFPHDNESHWESRGWKTGTANAIAKLHPETLLAEVDRLRAELAAESRLHGETCDDRDRAHDMADKLAAMIASEDVIGEHTGMNDPWQNTLDLYRDLVPVGDGTLADEIRQLRAERDQAGAQLAAVRADGMREAATALRLHCPTHGTAPAQFMVCHCPGADLVDTLATLPAGIRES